MKKLYYFLIYLTILSSCCWILNNDFESFENKSFKISHVSGFYNNNFPLSIESKIGGEIYYSLNGQPINQKLAGVMKLNGNKIFTKNLPRNSNHKIQSSLKLNEKGKWQEHMEMPMNGLSIRAGIIKNGELQEEIQLDYIIGDNNGEGINTLMINVDSTSFFGMDSGIYVVGENPSEPNYLKKGDKWQKPCSINYFDKEGKVIYSTNCGISVHGFVSREWGQKSLKLLAKKKFGLKKFKYDFFDNGVFNDKKVLLRSSHSGWKNGIYNETLNFAICENLNLETSKEKPVVVFINGEYWGLYFLSEKIDHHYLSNKFKIKKGELNIALDNGIADYGSASDFKDLVEFVKNNDLKVKSNYHYFSKQFDIKNLIDWYCAQLFIQNLDWPCNNTEMWKQTGEKNKLRHILIDVDASFYQPEMNPFNRFYYFTDNFRKEDFNRCNLFFRRLLRNERFVKKFEKRFKKLLETDFSTEKITKKYEELKFLHDLNYAIPFNIKRWFEHKQSASYYRTHEEREFWIEERNEAAKKQLNEFIVFVKKEMNKPFMSLPQKKK